MTEPKTKNRTLVRHHLVFGMAVILRLFYYTILFKKWFINFYTTFAQKDTVFSHEKTAVLHKTAAI